MKKVIFDSSALISLSSSCLFNGVGRMFESDGIRGIISSGVELESIINPMRVKRLELNAVRIRHGIEEGWLELVRLDEKDQSEVEKIMQKANHSLYSARGNLSLLQLGEVEALLLAEKLGAKVVAVDERTTRMLIEEPEKLRQLISSRRHTGIQKDSSMVRELDERFGGLSFVRSSELVALAFEKGFLLEEIGSGKKALEAALYSLKYMGCALSSSEIESFLGGKK